jgi:hypothetical protein
LKFTALSLLELPLSVGKDEGRSGANEAAFRDGVARNGWVETSEVESVVRARTGIKGLPGQSSLENDPWFVARDVGDLNAVGIVDRAGRGDDEQPVLQRSMGRGPQRNPLPAIQVEYQKASPLMPGFGDENVGVVRKNVERLVAPNRGIVRDAEVALEGDPTPRTRLDREAVRAGGDPVAQARWAAISWPGSRRYRIRSR